MQRFLAISFAVLAAGCSTGDIGAADDEPSLLASDAGTSTAESPAESPAESTPGPGLDHGADGAVDTSPPASPADAAPAVDEPTGPEPPPFPAYSKGTCPALASGPNEATSLNTGFPSGSDTRQFRVIVPSTYDGKSSWPVVFGYHWLGASSAGLLRDGELETAAAQLKFIVVLPDKLTNASGGKTFPFEWPFNDAGAAPRELTFFDDMLACVSAKLKVDRRRVYVFGVSAGALWTTYLSTTSHVQYVAAIETLSGGLGSLAGWSMAWAPQPNKFAALVLSGGAGDVLGVDFQSASTSFRNALVGDGHFTVACVHDKGHVMPPIAAPADGTTRFKPLWRFLLDHPYRVTSPYAATGLPTGFPSWCVIAK